MAVLSAVTVKADPFAYLASGNSSFGVINLQTGLYTPLGETLLGDSEKVLYGMGVANGLLFATTYETDAGALFTVDPANGHLTFVGNANANTQPAAAEGSGLNFWALGSTTSGLYAIDADSKNLYSVSATNGAATLIGNTGLTGFADWSQFSVGADSLYFANGSSLYAVNTTTGAATLIGNTGGPHIGAMVYENGLLYGGQNPSYNECDGPCEGPCQQNCEPPCQQDCGDGGLGAAEPVPDLNVVILSTETGTATIQAAVSGLAADDAFFALAPAAALATPEPSTGLLAGISAATLLFALRRKLRRQQA